MSGQEEGKKPADGSERINIKIVKQDENDVFFRVRRNTPLKMVIKAYYQKIEEEDDDTLVFLFDGRKINNDQTPDDLEMEDGAEIDAMLHQDGGADF